VFNQVNSSQVLTTAEVHAVLGDLWRRRARHADTTGTLLNLVLFELATCYGLRAGEIARLRLRDIVLTGEQRYIETVTLKRRRRQTGRRRGPEPRRQIPLDIVPRVPLDLETWKGHRRTMGAADGDPYLCTFSRVPVSTSQATGAFLGKRHRFVSADDPRAMAQLTGWERKPGKPLAVPEISRRYKVACHCLGAERIARIMCRHGRHTFASHALQRGVDPVRVQTWLGHTSLSVTAIYAHVIEDLTGPQPTIYDFDE